MKKIVFSLIIVSTFISCKENTNETVKTEDTVIVETPKLNENLETLNDTLKNKVKGSVKVELQKEEDVQSLK